jgi:hypothetical protein
MNTKAGAHAGYQPLRSGSENLEGYGSSRGPWLLATLHQDLRLESEYLRPPEEHESVGRNPHPTSIRPLVPS